MGIGNSMYASEIKDLHHEWRLKTLSKLLKSLGECNWKKYHE